MNHSALVLLFTLAASVCPVASLGVESTQTSTAAVTLVVIPTIEGDRCVKLSILKLADGLTAYNDYSIIDGVRKPGDLLPEWGTKDFQAIDMISSQAEFESPTEDVKDSDEITHLVEPKQALVKIVMQPLNLGRGYGNVYPRFLLRCKSGWIGDNHLQFVQDCRAVPTKRSFALSRFDLLLRGTQGKCPDGETGVVVHYKLDLSTVQEHVDLIKAAISERNYVPMAAINYMFNQQKFFRDYFTFFYDQGLKWAESRSK